MGQRQRQMDTRGKGSAARGGSQEISNHVEGKGMGGGALLGRLLHPG